MEALEGLGEDGGRGLELDQGGQRKVDKGLRELGYLSRQALQIFIVSIRIAWEIFRPCTWFRSSCTSRHRSNQRLELCKLFRSGSRRSSSGLGP